jgi:hypothetical protein
MTLRSALFCSAAFVAFAAPAMAQVTADEVWQNQIGYLSSLGFVVEATSQRDGASVTMSDVRMVWAVPMGFGAVTISSPDITMSENGDGTVAITYPDKFRMTLRADLTIEGETGSVGADIGIRLDGQSLVASGTPQAVTYDSQTTLMDIALDRIILEGGAGGPQDIPPVTFVVTIRDLLTDTTITDAGESYTIATVSTTGQSIFEVGFEDGFGTTSTTVGAVDTSSTTSTFVVPKTPVDWLNLTTALRNGLSLESTSEAVGSRQQTVASVDGSIVSDQSQTADRSTQSLTVSAAGLALGGNAQGVTFDISQDFMIPFPIKVSAEEMSGGFSMPLLADPAPQTVSFGMALRGLTVGDDLWALVDAGGVLPRDPATLAFSIDADVISRVDMLDIMAWEGVVAQIDMGQIPADIVSLRITGVEASAIGAALTGEGSFTFDNADRTTFPGFPRPEGEATVQMTGLYGVLDKLSQLGLLPMEAGMGARAAIGMFAQATGDDQLTSSFAIGPDGAMTVNGAPIPVP